MAHLSGSDDSPQFGELSIFYVRAYQRAGEFTALAAAASHIELQADVFHRFGAGIKRATNRFVRDVVAYADNHGGPLPLTTGGNYARRGRAMLLNSNENDSCLDC